MSKMPRVQGACEAVSKRYPQHSDSIMACIGRGGLLRSSKPKGDGKGCYIWRMVAFMVSPQPQHQCIPFAADFDIADSAFAHRTDKYTPVYSSDEDRKAVAEWDEKTWKTMHRRTQRRAFIKEELDPIVSDIVDAVPKSEWHGVKRWASVL